MKVQIDWAVVDQLRSLGFTAESEYVRSLHEDLHKTRKVNTALSDAFAELQLEMGKHAGVINGVVNDLTREQG